MTSDTPAVFAPAKINLTLHVTGQQEDGYHLLDSLVMFADLGDRLWITPGSEMALDVLGPFAAGVPADRRNLVWQAAELAGVTSHIKLEKNLPHGAGIGGGSTDAAAVLRHLGGAAGAETLGADVPVCLASHAQRMRGTGANLTALPDLPPVFAVLANPGTQVPTQTVFNALLEKSNPPMPTALPVFASTRELLIWLAQMRNDLEAPAIETAPIIAEVLTALSRLQGQYLSRMSGSGSTCFALFDNLGLAELGAKDLAHAHPDWWIRACRLS